MASESTTIPAAAWEKLRFVDEMTTNADAVQEELLAKILSENAETEYLRRLDLAGATDRETFKAKVPLISYEDIRPEIQRIADGDRSPILTAQPITDFLCSTGTSNGVCKLFPMTEEESQLRQICYSLFTLVLSRYIPDLEKGKGLFFFFVGYQTRTPGGLIVYSNNTHKSETFRKHASSILVTSLAAIDCHDGFQSMYIQMLCALCRRHEVVHVGGAFAIGLLRAIRFLELNWPQLAHDIATGTLSPKITDPSLRGDPSVASLAKDPELARFVTEQCSGASWEGIIVKIWPNTKYLNAVLTGTMAQYKAKVEFYSGGRLPIVSAAYASTECFVGINLEPTCDTSEISYTVMPNMAYFEFAPMEQECRPDRLVDLTQVEVGKEYEVVVTTRAGLYRYRLGDVLRVSGFRNSCPRFRFVRRKNVLLSVGLDKTSEVELQGAVENAAKLLRRTCGADVLEYTSRACTRDVPGHYVIYAELSLGVEGGWPSGGAMEECCLAMEESLSPIYLVERAKRRSIGPLEIRVVRTGTFEELIGYLVSRGAPTNQYKVPRCITYPPLLELLDSRVISSHSSTACPKWDHTQLLRQ